MTTSNQSPLITFNDGYSIPQLGFGTWNIKPEESEKYTRVALDAGYRHIDTAQGYDNEPGVGKAVRDSGLPREEVFITTKLWNSHQGYDSTLEAFENSRKKLGVDYVDLYLIHWPMPAVDLYIDSFKALKKLQGDGVIRSIGVSNFHEEHLDRLIQETGTTPAANQIELHPFFSQVPLATKNSELGIVTESYSPLGGPYFPLLNDETLRAVAQEVGKTPAQVAIRWQLQLGHVTIPKSVTPERIVENFSVFDFELTPEQQQRVSDINQDRRGNANPVEFDLDKPQK